jgi:hypothetical protein
MTTVRTTWGPSRPVWGFDIEARPGPWGGGDFTFRSMLSIAAGFKGGPVDYLAPDFTADALENFILPMRAGGILVVGHNAIRYDLPMLNGTLMKMGLPSLGPQLVTDTCAHLKKKDYAFSASLGNMAERFGIRAKGSMSEYAWEQVYAHKPEYLDKLRAYNVGDVEVTLALRAVLLERGMLKSPRWWRP